MTASSEAKPVEAPIAKKKKQSGRVAIVIAIPILVALVVMGLRTMRSESPCATGFTRLGARCCPTPIQGTEPGTCAMTKGLASCPGPLVVTAHGCDVPADSVVLVPSSKLTIGPSDWEAEGRVAPRTIEVAAFRIDRFEVTFGRLCAQTAAILGGAPCTTNDPGRAAFDVSFDMARRFCASFSSSSGDVVGRLPTEDEWLAAAAGSTGNTGGEKRARRYPWGDTGAVCRRAAFGLSDGPCAERGNGADTAGAHPDGVTPGLEIHDLAGNVAEWVETGDCGDPLLPPAKPCMAAVRGGSWKTSLATELRTWARREVPSNTRDTTIGFRCAYPAR